MKELHSVDMVRIRKKFDIKDILSGDNDRLVKAQMIFGSIFSIVLSIYSFLNIYYAYVYFMSIQSDFSTLVDHWQSKPVIDIQLVSPNKNCPHGYAEGIVKDNDRKVEQTIGAWPGKYAWCECGDTGFTHTYDYTKYRCNCGTSGKKCESHTKCSETNNWGDGQCSNEALSRGCKTETRTKTKTQTFKTGLGNCAKNATIAGCRTDKKVDSIPLKSWKQHKICYQRGPWSATQRMQHLNDKLDGCDTGVACQTATESQDPTHTICAPSVEECPLVSIPIGKKTGNIMKITDSNDPMIDQSTIQSRRPIVEFRMTIGQPCWIGTFGKKGRTNNRRVKNKYDTNCQVKDNRFILWDEISEPELYNENNIPVSGHHLLGDGKTYTEYQYFNTSKDVNWTLWYRPEIFWENECEAGNVKALTNHLKPLMHLGILERVLVLFHALFGLLILGLFLPMLTLLHVRKPDSDLWCVPGSGKTERRNLNLMKGVLKIISTLGKFTPLILSFVITEEIHWFFITAAKDRCSDDLTNETMLQVGSEIDRLKESHFRNIIVDSILFLYTGFTIFKEIYDYRKSKQKEREVGYIASETPSIDVDDDVDQSVSSEHQSLWDHKNDDSASQVEHAYLERFNFRH